MPMIFRIPSHCRIIRTFYSTVRPAFELVIVTVHRTVTFSPFKSIVPQRKKVQHRKVLDFLGRGTRT